MYTDGFYKIDDNTKELLHGPNYVLNQNFNLHKNIEKNKLKKDRKNYPDNWFWFDNLEEACLFFGIEYSPDLENNNSIIKN